MSDILHAEIQFLNNSITFSSRAGDNPEIITDYYPPLGNTEGYKPLELFLVSFETCVSGTVLPLQRRMQKSIGSYRMTVEGIRKPEHPIGFSKITLKPIVQSPDMSIEDLQKAVLLAE